jgi:hypothetical protein
MNIKETIDTIELQRELSKTRHFVIIPLDDAKT